MLKIKRVNPDVIASTAPDPINRIPASVMALHFIPNTWSRLDIAETLTDVAMSLVLLLETDSYEYYPVPGLEHLHPLVVEAKSRVTIPDTFADDGELINWIDTVVKPQCGELVEELRRINNKLSRHDTLNALLCLTGHSVDDPQTRYTAIFNKYRPMVVGGDELLVDRGGGSATLHYALCDGDVMVSPPFVELADLRHWLVQSEYSESDIAKLLRTADA